MEWIASLQEILENSTNSIILQSPHSNLVYI